MSIEVYRVGDYEVARRTDSKNPELIVFVVRTRFPLHDMAAWGVITSMNRGYDRLMYRLMVMLHVRVINFDRLSLVKLEKTVDDAFLKACRYAERLAGLSEETRRQIDRHAEEIRYRTLARIEIEEALIGQAEASAS